jgi:uncharacterized protein (TIRG00374 family)
MKRKGLLRNAFSWWKISLAVLFGLSVAFYLIYNSLSQEKYIEVPAGEGDYVWVDSNQNNIIDFNDSAEFKVSSSGNFKIERLGDTLRNMNWSAKAISWLFVAILFMFGRDLFYIIRIRILTRNELTWKRGFFVIMLWEFASALSPGVVGGAAVAMFILNREKIPLGRSTAIVVITALMDNLFYVLMIPFVFLFIKHADLFPSEVAGSAGVTYIFWSGFIIILAVCAFLFTSLFLLPTLATRFLRSVFSLPLLRKWKTQAIETGREVETAARELKHESRSFWVKSFAATCASWISRYLVINCIFQAFLNLNFTDHIQILGKQLVLWLFMLVSPTPGASGIAEYAFGELLSSYSSSAILIAVLAIVWRLVSYFPYLVIGAVIVPRWLRINKR